MFDRQEALRDYYCSPQQITVYMGEKLRLEEVAEETGCEVKHIIEWLVDEHLDEAKQYFKDNKI